MRIIHVEYISSCNQIFNITYHRPQRFPYIKLDKRLKAPTSVILSILQSISEVKKHGCGLPAALRGHERA